jgi:hypothetical protein
MEEFFRSLRGEPGLRLPRFKVYAGPLSGLLLDSIGMGAITFGRRVFLSKRLVREGPDGRLTAPGWLLVHEGAHVLQYERKGFVKFLFGYLRAYWAALREGGRWGGAGRMAAYLAIPDECEAREAEHAFRASREKGIPAPPPS